MSRLLENFDRISFWLGFVAATLFWWLFLRLRPALLSLLRRGIEALRIARFEAASGVETRLCNEMLRQVEASHLAAPLFALDEVLIQPRLLAPARPVIPGEVPFTEGISLQAVPFSPGWPELASQYGVPVFSLSEALSNGRNIAIIGRAGIGKSIAIADLVIQAARREALPGDLKGRVPLLLHVADLIPFLPVSQEILSQGAEAGITNPSSALDILSNAAAARIPSLSQKRMVQYLRQAVFGGRVLLLIDGLDELAMQDFDRVTHYLQALVAGFSGLRIAVAAPGDYLGRLIKLGFVPFTLAEWTRAQRKEFIQKWSRLWIQHIQTPESSQTTADPLILNAWVESGAALLTPLELTLKLWAAYAGDSLGPGPVEAIEAYVRRQLFTPEDPLNQPARSAVEAFALLNLVAEQPVLSIKDAQAQAMAEAIEPDILRSLPTAPDNGILRSFFGARLGFAHTILFSYLSACAMEARMLFPQALQRFKWPAAPQWSTRQTALGFLAALLDPEPRVIQALIESSRPPLHRTALSIARWLRYAPEGASWRPAVMHHLAGFLQDDSLPLGLRGSALSAVVLSGTPGIPSMLRQFSRSPSPAQRQLAALGYGLLPEITEIEDLKLLFADPIPNVFRAAGLALAAIGSRTTLEIIADGLLHGEEELRRAAAEALATNSDEGYATLQEGATLDDLLVRRAVVFGLQRIRQPWSQLVLETIAMQDSQWVVKNAASQALEELARPDPSLPSTQPPLQDIPWLLAFAGQRGVGVSSSRAAIEMLVQCLKEGNEEQKLAAMQVCAGLLDPSFVPHLYHFVLDTSGDLIETAYQTLWAYELSGIEVHLAAKLALGTP